MAENILSQSSEAPEPHNFPIGRILRISFGMIAGMIAGLALAITITP
jgi:hypothetical protein